MMIEICVQILYSEQAHPRFLRRLLWSCRCGLYEIREYDTRNGCTIG